MFLGFILIIFYAFCFALMTTNIHEIIYIKPFKAFLLFLNCRNLLILFDIKRIL